MNQLNFKQGQIFGVNNEKGIYGFMNDIHEFVPFDIKKVYYYQPKTPENFTGQHCHKIEQEVFVMAAGSCTAVIDRGNGKEDLPFAMNDYMYVGNYVWHGFKDFSPGAVLLAISSTGYSADRSDYIEDFELYNQERGEWLTV